MATKLENILVTGGAGFIGSSFVRQWLADDVNSTVVNLDLLTYAGNLRSLGECVDDPRHQFVRGDIADRPLVDQVLAEHRPRCILHLAAETHVDQSIERPPKFVETNVLGTCVLLEAARHYWTRLPLAEQQRFRLVVVSTDEVFGVADAAMVFTVDSPLQPNSPYAASKAAAEQLAHAFAHTYGLPVIIVNPTNNYGPRQSPEKLVPKMILAAARREPLPLYGNGLQERDWIHVDDCCHGLARVVARGEPGQRYLLGSGVSRPNRWVVETICDLVDDRLRGEVAAGVDGGPRRELIAQVADRPGHDRRYAIDAAVAQQQLAWRPQVDVADGLRETAAWYLSQSQWVAEAEQALALRNSSGK